MTGRNPTQKDIDRMKRAVSYVTAYDLGVENRDFKEFLSLVNEEKEYQAMTQALAQFSWLLLQSMDSQGMDKDDVLGWYGLQFAKSVCEE